MFSVKRNVFACHALVNDSNYDEGNYDTIANVRYTVSLCNCKRALGTKREHKLHPTSGF